MKYVLEARVISQEDKQAGIDPASGYIEMVNSISLTQCLDDAEIFDDANSFYDYYELIKELNESANDNEYEILNLNQKFVELKLKELS